MNQRFFLQKLFASVHFWLPLSGISAFFLLLLQLRYINTGSAFSGWELKGILREGCLIIIEMIVVLYFVYYAIRFFDRKFPADEFSIKRYIYELFVVVLLGFVINKFFHYLFISIIVIPEDDQEGLKLKLRNLLLITQTLIIIMYGLLTAFRIYKNLQQKQLDILKWQREFANSQFETLKNQLNPHFLFNSLSVLTSLIYADKDIAEQFIEKLSKTYRYLLDQNEKEAVPIGLELDFLHNFEFLVKQRYGEKIRFTIESDTTQGSFILPHSFLIVLEYIIGSSIMSIHEPLHIEILIKQKNLYFRYNHQPKQIINQQLLQQLNSLQMHYTELSNKMELISDDYAQQQIIKIPLFLQYDECSLQ